MQTPDLAIFGEYKHNVQQNIPLSRYSFALCGGPAACLVSAEDTAMLEKLVLICLNNNLNFKVLGGLSNVLISDAGYEGVIILNRTGKIDTQSESDFRLVQTGSGASIRSIVSFCTSHSLSGMEWAAGLPGTIGGAIYGNAGAFGTDISSRLESLTLLDQTGIRKDLSSSELQFSYRSSILKRSDLNSVILSACIRLSKDDPQLIIEREKQNQEKRTASQPHGVGSLGSVFKNPPGTSAGKLIEDAGLKGTQIGQAQISTKHANFIITKSGVRSADYLALLHLAQQMVQVKFGIRLEPEIELLGFGEH